MENLYKNRIVILSTNLLILICSLLLSMNNFAQSVYTPNGVQVPPAALFTYTNSYYFGTTNAQLQAFQNAVQNGTFGPSCVVLGNYSRQYNCHGYAWHVSTGGGQIGIDQPTGGGVTPYISGSSPSYTQTSYNGSQAKLRVRYTKDHSAVTAGPGLYISKWGAGPLVRHSAGDVPPAAEGFEGYGEPDTYWTCNYTPPLTSVSIDYNAVSNSYLPLNHGSHTIYITNSLDPDTGPSFSSTMASTVITSQSGPSAYFTFSGPSNYGGLSISYCGTFRHSFTFYKPSSGARMGVFPNPASEEATITISNEGQNLTNDIIAVNLDEEVNKLVNLQLLDGNNKVIGDYSNSFEGNRHTIKLDQNLKGIYYLRAKFSDGTVETKRVLIEK